jgi:hypothetical protein
MFFFFFNSESSWTKDGKVILKQLEKLKAFAVFAVFVDNG